MSIVSVYCKSLLRLFIVGVYCKYLLCFIVFSVQNVARSLVLVCFRLQKLFFESVLLYFRSHTCKKPYKTRLGIIFCISNLPNHVFYRCKCFAPLKTIHFFKKLERECPGRGDPWIFRIFWFCGMWRRFLSVCVLSGSIFCHFPSFCSEVSLCT